MEPGDLYDSRSSESLYESARVSPNVSENINNQESLGSIERHSTSTTFSRLRMEFNESRYSSLSSRLRNPSVLLKAEFTLNKLNVLELDVYGRESELQRLQSSVHSVMVPGKTRPSMVSVKGYPGIGKSTLVQALEPFVEEQGGVFAVGKFDMESRSGPYSAFRAAFTVIIDQIMRTSKREDILCLQRSTKEALGADWSVLVDVIPNLYLILGKSDEPVEAGDAIFSDNLEGKSRKRRLRFYFQTFIRCLSSTCKPIIIVLDDVQWADPPSIELMDALLCDSNAPPVLLIATYRENEMDENHPFCKLVGELEQKQIPVEEISLDGLDVQATNQFLSTLLRMEESKTTDLAELVRSKTGGNPFFLLQFLQTLIDEKKLAHNLGTLRWYWVVEDIQDMMVTDNVAGLLATRISSLSREMQLVLQVASCLGRSVERSVLLDVLSSLLSDGVLSIENEAGLTLERFVEDLVELGLLELVDSKLCFAHDQIQAVARESIPEDLKPPMEYHMVRYFMSDDHDLNHNEHELFLAAGLSTSGIGFVNDSNERVSLAKLNLMACEHAMRKSAFDAALKYAEVGVKFLGDDKWDANYDLTLKLESSAVDAAYCCGDFERMEFHIEGVLHKAASIYDKVSALRTRSLAYGVQERFEEGIENGLFALKELGLKEPTSNPNVINVLRHLLSTKRAMRRQTLDSLMSLPLMTDRKMVLGMEIIDMMLTTTYIKNKRLLMVLVLRSVVWSLRFGVNEYSPTAFAFWGIISLKVFGDVDTGAMFAEASLQLAEKLECKATIPKVVHIVFGHIHHWTHYLRASIHPSWYGFVKGMEVGLVELAMYNLGQHDVLQFVTGSFSLDRLLSDAEAHVKLMREYKQEAVRNYCLCFVQVLYKLVGKDENPNQLSGVIMQEHEMLRVATDTGNSHLRVWIASFSMDLNYLFGDYQSAGLNSELSNQFLSLNLGSFLVHRHCFIQALTAVALYREGIQKRRNLNKAERILKIMKRWRSQGNVNVVHMTCLIEAELAAAKCNKTTAAEFYKDSIRIATRNGFLNDRAMSHERAAEFFLGAKDHYWASFHVEEAVRCYQEWKAHAKVDHLRNKFAELLEISGTNSQEK